MNQALLNGIIAKAHKTAVEHGWWEAGERDPDEVHALIHSELSEALEHYRKDAMSVFHHSNGKPDGFGVEIADVVVRCADSLGRVGYQSKLTYFSHESMAKYDFVTGKKASLYINKLHDMVSATSRNDGFKSVQLMMLEDIIWACAWVCQQLDVDLEQALELKMAYNETRPYRHGNLKA